MNRGITAHDGPSGQEGSPPWLAHPIEHLARLQAQAPNGRRVVIGLAGLPGSGKSTLAQWWVDQLNTRHGADMAMVIGMDGFHLTRAELADMPNPAAALARRGAPWTFDPQALALRLKQVRDLPGTDSNPAGSGTVRWPGFAHGVGDPQWDAITIPATVRLVLLEGLYLLHRGDGWDLSALLDECWFLDVALELAMERLTLRHMATRGISRAQAVARIDTNDRLNAAIVAASCHRADWRVADTPR